MLVKRNDRLIECVCAEDSHYCEHAVWRFQGHPPPSFVVVYKVIVKGFEQVNRDETVYIYLYIID